MEALAPPSLIGVQPITPDEAQQAYAGCAGLDPEGLNQHLTSAHAGQCFRLTLPDGELVYTLSAARRECWIHAAAGTGRDMARRGLLVIEHQARVSGCKEIGFQTMRAGLIRRAERMGYRICGAIGSGFIMRKAIHG